MRGAIVAAGGLVDRISLTSESLDCRRSSNCSDLLADAADVLFDCGSGVDRATAQRVKTQSCSHSANLVVL